MRKFIFLVFSIINLSNSYSQIKIEGIVEKINGAIKSKNINLYKSFFCRYMLAGIYEFTDKQCYPEIIITKNNNFEDLKKVKVRKIGNYKNLYDYFHGRVLNESIGIDIYGEAHTEILSDGTIIPKELCFDCPKSLYLISKNKSSLDIITDIEVFEIRYQYMFFVVYISGNNWKIIEGGQYLVFDHDDQIELEKKVIYIYRGIYPEDLISN